MRRIPAHLVDEMWAKRGPFYRRLCVTLAKQVAANPPVGAAEEFSDGFRAGCAAVAAVIEQIDKPLPSTLEEAQREIEGLRTKIKSLEAAQA